MDLLTSMFSTKAGVLAGVAARGCSARGACSTMRTVPLRTVPLRTVLTVSETQNFGQISEGRWWVAQPGPQQRWIGHGDAGRHIACPGRDDGGSVHRSLIGAFLVRTVSVATPRSVPSGCGSNDQLSVEVSVTVPLVPRHCSGG